jgi:hypothetical protein
VFMRARSTVALAGLLFAWNAWAHDYWLLPDRLRVTPGARVALSLWVGDGFVPDEARGWQRERTTRFVHVSSTASEDLLARPVEGASPLLDVALGAAGGRLFVMERNASRIELPADRFEHYLRDEGLDGIIAARRALGESSRAGRERYTRYLKTYVQAGSARDAVSSRTMGQAFELVPLARRRRHRSRARSVRRARRRDLHARPRGHVAPAGHAHDSLRGLRRRRLGELVDLVRVRPLRAERHRVCRRTHDPAPFKRRGRVRPSMITTMVVTRS